MPQARDEAGNIWEVDAQGNPVRLIQAAGAGQILPDPAAQYEAPRAAAQAQSAQAGAQVDQATVGAEITKAMADARRAEAEARRAEAESARGFKEYTETQRADAIKAFNRALDLDKQITRLRELFEEGPGSTSGVMGLADYAPLTRNQRFDAAGNAARAMIRDVLGFTGTELNTPREIELNIGSYIPSSSDRDEVILDKLAQLENIRDSRLRGIAATLGGFPDPQGNIVPIPPGQEPNALTATRIVSGQPLEAAGAGATIAGQPVDPEYQREYTAWVTQNGGRFTPEQYAAFRSGLDQKYGYGATADYLEEGQRIAEAFERGGSLNLTIPPIEQPLSGVDQFRNDLVSSPVGAAATGFADMAGFGGVSALAPNQMAALTEAHPVATTVGQMGGAVLGTGLLSGAARQTIGRAAPQLLQGGNRAALARDLATDAAYSGIYGANVGDDPLASAGLGAVGSLVGRGVGTGVGAAVAGPRLDRAVEVLRSRNIPMTVPQQLGGIAKTIEDRATSFPLVGDMIRARRMEGLEAFNREAFQEAGAPISATVRDIGEEGVQQLTDQIGSAYDTATAGVSVPFDEQFLQDFAAAAQQGQALPRDLRRRLGQVLDARVAPIIDTGQMTGEQFQQAIRALKKTRNNPPQQFGGFEEDYRNAVTAAMDALEGQMTRGAPQVAPGLSAANAANRNKSALERAVRAASGGSQSGEVFTFTPNQLQRAGQQVADRYPGPQPMGELANNAQRVLPSQVPDSGTAGRAAQMLMPGALAGSGAGLGFAAGGGMEGAQTGAGLSALATAALILGGTRGGQKALQKAIIDRGPRAQMIGRQIRDRRGLFGSAALPLVIAE